MVGEINYHSTRKFHFFNSHRNTKQPNDNYNHIFDILYIFVYYMSLIKKLLFWKIKNFLISRSRKCQLKKRSFLCRWLLKFWLKFDCLLNKSYFYDFGFSDRLKPNNKEYKSLLVRNFSTKKQYNFSTTMINRYGSVPLLFSCKNEENYERTTISQHRRHKTKELRGV